MEKDIAILTRNKTASDKDASMKKEIPILCYPCSRFVERTFPHFIGYGTSYLHDCRPACADGSLEAPRLHPLVCLNCKCLIWHLS